MIPILAIGSILACLVSKMFLTVQTKALERKLGRERESLHEARRELGKAAGKMKLLDAEVHQLEGRAKKLQGRIDRFNKTLGTFADEEKKAKEKAAAQEQMMRDANKK